MKGGDEKIYDTGVITSSGVRREARSKMAADIKQLNPENLKPPPKDAAKKFKMRATKRKSVKDNKKHGKSKFKLVDEVTIITYSYKYIK